MSDTWRLNAIVEAILIIADKKIAQANFDKTIKATIYSIDDKATGTYSVKYQDSIFTANSTSTKINYLVGQQVLVLVPGNDMTRAKTIIGGVSNTAITYQEIPLADDISNKIGPSGSSLSLNIGLSSYAGDIVVDLEEVNINDISEYVKRGDSITLGMVARTSLASGQIGGIFGITFNLIFKNSVTGEEEVKPLSVTNQDVIGNPYSLLKDTPVKVLIRDIDTENFVKIDSIQAFCRNFPLDESKKDIIDIVISDISINGAAALTESELNGYILHIDCSKNGDTLSEEVPKISLMAKLKVNGNTTTQKTQYYWFRENGTVFKGNDKYNPYGGYGWECLNVKSEKTWVPKFSGLFEFNITGDDLENNSAHALQKVTKILCVGIYDERLIVKGLIQIINNAIDTSIYIDSDEKVQLGDNIINRTVYYLDNGSPNLKCVYDKENKGEIEYLWSIRSARGGAVQSPLDPEQSKDFRDIEILYNYTHSKYILMDLESKSRYQELYDKIVENYNKAKKELHVVGDTYYNFPISSITDYSVVSCAVTLDGVYRGTASITLYNKTSLEGMYSLNLENGTQVFQYDGKGNSPTSPQLEKKLEIRPLTFTLIDNQGKEIPHDQIRNNGWIKWIIPNTQTLLSSVNNGLSITGDLDLTVIRADLPLPASSYNVYSDLDSFNYAIADQYDVKKDINYIWLNIKFKDVILDAYTNFTFPKDGDPGTNGTDKVAKIVGSNATDRFYLRDKEPEKLFDDTGAEVDNLKFLLYNNSIIINDSADFWCCPPITMTGNKPDFTKGNTYLSGDDGWTKPKLGVVSKTVENILTDKPINIIRAQKNIGGNSGDLKYYAELPICTLFVTNPKYRLRVRPKTGFSYAVYLEDGSRPDYDNTMPFEVIVEELQELKEEESGFWVLDQSVRNYTWLTIGNIEEDTNKNKEFEGNTNKKFFKPKDKFAGDDLTSAIVVSVEGIGCIHIPVYMILNRYGHSALNGWDGNSIQLNANGDTILAPQVGAGSKDLNNTFTGVLMGNVKTKTSDDIGLFGYDRGNRSIFMDAKTGKTVLGKAEAGQITIDPSLNTARIYSGNYSEEDGTGMEIDLTDPHIQFGSGHFSVNKNGNITAKGGGTIAGWNITNNTLYKSNVGMNSNPSNSKMYDTDTNNSLSTSNGNMAFWAGSGTGNLAKNFYVTHNGYLFSKSGKIAGWNLDSESFYKRVGSTNLWVGMNSNPSSTYDGYKVSGHSSKAFFANGDNFYVTHDGYLRSTSGQIANWKINKARLSDGKVGMGQVVFQKTNKNSKNPFGEAITARLWGSEEALVIEDNENGVGTVADSNSSKIEKLNFAVSDTGKLYSKAGKIGGWNITETQLAGGNTIIDSDGSLSNNGAGNGSWAIYNDGHSVFNNITATNLTATTGTISGFTANDFTANNGGLIAGWTIGADSLSKNDIVISSTGTINNGNNWFINKDGDAYFKNIYGTVKSGLSLSSSGGGGGGGGSWSMPGGGGSPSWNYDGYTMSPQTIKSFTTLKLRKRVASKNYIVPTLTKTLKLESEDKTYSCTINLTCNGQPVTGTVSVEIPEYSLNVSGAVITGQADLNEKQIVTGWHKDTKVTEHEVMSSPVEDANYGDG